MSFLADNFWKFIFLAAIAFGGNVYYKKYQKEQEWTRTIKSYGDLTEKLRITEPSSAGLAKWEADYWRLMLRTDEVVDNLNSGKLVPPRDKQSVEPVEAKPTLDKLLREFLKAAGAKTGYPANPNEKGSAAKIASNDPVVLFMEVVAENYTILSDCGVWEDPAVRAALATGEAPKVKNGPYAGETLKLVRRISPHLFRGGITEPCNIIILPESAAAMYFPEVDDTMLAFCQRMSSCGIIDSKSAEAVRLKHPLHKKN